MLKIKGTLILLLMMLMVAPTLAVEDNLTIIGDDETAIREFLRIYLRDMSPPDTETTVFVGQFPDELGVDIPEFEGRIVGAVVREGPYPTTEMIFISPESVDVIDQQFQTGMEAMGWERIGINYGQRGFIFEQTAYADYCSTDYDVFVNINLRQIDDETQARVNINHADPYMCSQNPNMEEAQSQDPYLRLPKLIAPEGVTMLVSRGGGGGGGGYPGTLYAATSTWLQSDVLSLAELVEVYDAQLVDNGWELLSTETGEHTSLSLWTFEDKDYNWSGYFSLMESATEDGHYYATIMVEQISE